MQPLAYSQPLSDLVCCHECDYHKYADDTQLSKGAPPDQFQFLCDVQTCIESLLGWMYSNKLKINAEKIDVLPVASTTRLSSVGRDSVDIGGKHIPFRSSVRNLGVHLDQTLSMQQHISSVCCAAYLELRSIASVRPYLTQSATAQLVSSAITSQLDYCNSILAGLPLKKISRLQRVQNNAAKLVLRKSKYDHVTPLLQELHWLPIKFWPQYKIATFVYRFFVYHFSTRLSYSNSMCIWTNMKPPTSTLTPTLTPRMNVLPECFSCFMVVKRARVRESAGSGRDGGWGERMYACETEGQRERGEGEVRVCVCVVCVLV